MRMAVLMGSLRNRSPSARVADALDHAFGPYGLGTWSGKPAGIIGASAGMIGEGSRNFLQGWVGKFLAWVRLRAAA